MTNGNTTGTDAGDSIRRTEPVGFAGDDGVPVVDCPAVVPGVLVPEVTAAQEIATRPDASAFVPKINVWLRMLLGFVGSLFGKNPMLAPNVLVVTAQIRTAIKDGQAIEPAGLKLIDDTLNAIDHVAGSDNYGDALPKAIGDIMLIMADGKEIAAEIKLLNPPTPAA